MLSKFVIIPRNTNETGNVSIECTASGNPTPVVTISNPNGTTVPHNIGKAGLSNTHRSQAGFYTCRASNGIKSAVSAMIELVVSCMWLTPFIIILF